MLKEHLSCLIVQICIESDNTRFKKLSSIYPPEKYERDGRFYECLFLYEIWLSIIPQTIQKIKDKTIGSWLWSEWDFCNWCKILNTSFCFWQKELISLLVTKEVFWSWQQVFPTSYNSSFLSLSFKKYEWDLKVIWSFALSPLSSLY